MSPGSQFAHSKRKRRRNGTNSRAIEMDNANEMERKDQLQSLFDGNSR
jgi:hypothetical protein